MSSSISSRDQRVVSRGGVYLVSADGSSSAGVAPSSAPCESLALALSRPAQPVPFSLNLSRPKDFLHSRHHHKQHSFGSQDWRACPATGDSNSRRRVGRQRLFLHFSFPSLLRRLEASQESPRLVDSIPWNTNLSCTYLHAALSHSLH